MGNNLGRKLADGRTAEVFAWGANWVVKLYREGWDRGAVDYEYNQAIASQRTGYRVPQVQQQVEIDGRYGIVYERIEGSTMIEDIQKSPLKFIEYARMMADMHVDMHTRKVEGMGTSLKILTYKINHADGLSEGLKEKILAYLNRLPHENKLLHGDFHPGNIIMTANGPVIIDWIDGNSGHPMADLARSTVIGTVGIPRSEGFARIFFRVFVSVYLNHYFKTGPYTREDLNTWLLPVAAARLSEEIAHEKEDLIKWVNRLAKKAGLSQPPRSND